MIPNLYPNAARLYTPDVPASGLFRAGLPLGVTVHYTASGSMQSALDEEIHGLGYHLIIDRDGTVVQTCYLNKKVNHAGIAIWNTVSPNSHHAAIALVSWGLLDDRGLTYAGKMLPADEIKEWNGKKWHKATDAQEKSLIQALNWFMLNGIKPENICGHDECALPKGRKVDPGGIMSFTIQQFRNSNR